MKKRKFADGGPSYENNIRDGGTSFIDEFEKSRAKVKIDEEKPRFETKEGENEMISKIPGIRERAKKYVESGGKEESKPAPKATPAPKAIPKPAAKATPKVKTSLFMPDFSNEDLDEMDAKEAANERQRESKALLNRTPLKKMAKGGSASSRADGCAIRGKTRA